MGTKINVVLIDYQKKKTCIGKSGTLRGTGVSSVQPPLLFQVCSEVISPCFLSHVALAERFILLIVKDSGNSPRETTYGHEVFYLFLFLATEFQRTSTNHLHLRTYFLECGNGAQGFGCVPCSLWEVVLAGF